MGLGRNLIPLQLPELAIDLPPHSVMPKHGEHVVSFADIESVKVHKKKSPSTKRALRCDRGALQMVRS